MRSSQQPLFFLGLAFAGGLLTGRMVAPPPSVTFVFAAAGTLATLAALVCLCALKKSAAPPSRLTGIITLATLAALLSFYALGAAYWVSEGRSVAPNRVRRLLDEKRLDPLGQLAEITGVLTRPAEFTPAGLYLNLRVEKMTARGEEFTASGVVRLFAPIEDAGGRARHAALELRRGARLRIMTKLKRADEYRNPGVDSFVAALDRRGVDANGMIKSSLLIERLDDEPVFVPLFWLDELRGRWLASIDRLFDAETSGVMKATLLGDRHYLSRGMAERFREGGTFHLIVISGMHVSFLGALVFALARRLTASRGGQFLSGMTIVWGYALMVGAESSIARAALMFTLASFAAVLARPHDALGGIGCALLAQLAWRPGELFDPSFQLTFLSVFAIVAIAWPLTQKLGAVGAWRPTRAAPYPPAAPAAVLAAAQILFWDERAWRAEMKSSVYTYRLIKHSWAARLGRSRMQIVVRHAFIAVLVSASVQAALLPFLIVYFHRFSCASLLLNVWVGLLMAGLSLLTIAAVALATIGDAWAAPLVRLAESLNWLLTHSVDPFVEWGIASWRVPEYAGLASALYLIYYVPLVVLLIALAKWNPLRAPAEEANGERGQSAATRLIVAALAQGLLTLVLLAHPWSARLPMGRLEINFLDVGQGDAALVVLPDGSTLLVDGGGRVNHQKTTEVGEESFEPDRRSVGEAVVAEYLWARGIDRVDYLLATHADADHTQGLADVARLFRVRAAFVARTPLKFEYQQLAASLDAARVPRRVIGAGDRLHFGAVTVDVLWPPRQAGPEADWGNDESIVLRINYGARRFLLTGDIEKKAEAQLAGADLHCDVVKVAHHGSKTSSTPEFVRAARPAITVVSVGRVSPFNHPSPEVMTRWRDAGARIYTTGEMGTITISTDGRDLRTSTFVHP